MAERPAKRMRGLSTEDSEGADDWEEESRRLHARPQNTSTMDRSRRGRDPSPSVDRSPSASSDAAPPKRSIRLNMKPPSRLQELKDESDSGSNAKRGTLSRSSKNKKPVIDDPSSVEEDSELSEEGEDEDEELDGGQEEGDVEDSEEQVESEQEEDEPEDEPEDEEGQEMQEDESDEELSEQEDSDVEMEDESAPPPERPKIKITAPRKPSPNQALKQKGRTIQSVEERELANPDIGEEDGDEDLDEDDEELGEDEFDEDGNLDDRADVITADAIGEDELDTDDSGTPDPAKMTQRQRRVDSSMLQALSNEAQKKKFFTPEQITVRRAEMARRRKDLSEKRNEMEKKDTLKRLLEKPAAPKRRNKAQMMADAEREEFGTPSRTGEAEGAIETRKGYVRTIINAKGTTVAVPGDWLDKEAGRLFAGIKANTTGGFTRPGLMVEVIE